MGLVYVGPAIVSDVTTEKGEREEEIGEKVNAAEAKAGPEARMEDSQEAYAETETEAGLKE